MSLAQRASVSDLSTITYMMDKTNGGGGGGGKSNKSLYYNRPTVTLFYTYVRVRENHQTNYMNLVSISAHTHIYKLKVYELCVRAWAQCPPQTAKNTQ